MDNVNNQIKDIEVNYFKIPSYQFLFKNLLSGNVKLELELNWKTNM